MRKFNSTVGRRKRSSTVGGTGYSRSILPNSTEDMLVFLIGVLLLQDASAAVLSTSLLWPIPKQVIPTSSNVRMLDPDNFSFYSVIGSDLVNQAFQRYEELIFKRPTPFYPDGASVNVQEQMKKLTVKVGSTDESLNEDTDESCEFLSIAAISSHKTNLLKVEVKTRVWRSYITNLSRSL